MAAFKPTFHELYILCRHRINRIKVGDGLHSTEITGPDRIKVGDGLHSTEITGPDRIKVGDGLHCSQIARADLGEARNCRRRLQSDAIGERSFEIQLIRHFRPSLRLLSVDR